MAGRCDGRWQTPRAVKRFLNNLAIREQIADEAGAHLPLDVLVKMYPLELRHLSEFKTLAALGSDERTDLLRRWEDWADGKDDAAKPAEVTEATQAWAQNEPRRRHLSGFRRSGLAVRSHFSGSGSQVRRSSSVMPTPRP